MKYLQIFLSILWISVTLSQCQSSKLQEQEEELPPEILQAIENRIAEGLNPSIVLALIDSNGIHHYHFGKTASDGKEVDENTIYEIGSITKVFTAILLAQQAMDDDLKLDEAINTYLPDSGQVPVMGDQPITFGHLSDHTSGLPRMPDNFNPANPHKPFADYHEDQLYEFISHYTPTRVVGVAYEYSNLAQGLLGHILALNKNVTYEELMIQTIADPLEMPNTCISFTQNMRDHLALGHQAGQVVENWDIPTLAGAGAIRSSTADMAQFISANLGYRPSPLSQAMELSHQVRHDKAENMRVGLGWHIHAGQEGDVIWHNGGTGGYRSFVGFVKETGKGVVLLSNSTAGADDIGFRLLDTSFHLE